MKVLTRLLLFISIAPALHAAEDRGATTTSTAAAKPSAPAVRPSPGQHQTPEKWIGVTADRIPDLVRSHLPNLPPDQGLIIQNIAKDSPAVVAGLERSDIIVRADGQPVGNPHDLQAILNRRNFATLVRLDLIHKAAPKTVYCLVLENPDTGAAASREARNPFRGLNGDQVSVQFSCTDTDGRRLVVSAGTLSEIGRKAEQDDEFREKLQRMFDGLSQNPEGVTVVLRPIQEPPAPQANR